MKKNPTDSIIDAEIIDAEIEYPASDADTEELENDDLPSEEIGEDTIEVYDKGINPITKKPKFSAKDNLSNYYFTNRIFQPSFITFKSSEDKSTTTTIATQAMTDQLRSLSKT